MCSARVTLLRTDEVSTKARSVKKQLFLKRGVNKAYLSLLVLLLRFLSAYLDPHHNISTSAAARGRQRSTLTVFLTLSEGHMTSSGSQCGHVNVGDLWRRLLDIFILQRLVFLLHRLQPHFHCIDPSHGYPSIQLPDSISNHLRSQHFLFLQQITKIPCNPNSLCAVLLFSLRYPSNQLKIRIMDF